MYNFRIARLRHLSCKPGNGSNVSISKNKFESITNRQNMSNSMRCSSVLNRNRGGRWRYITDTTDATDATDTTSTTVDEEIIYAVSNILTNLTTDGDTPSGITPNVLGRIVSDTSYNTETTYSYLLDINSPVTHSFSPTGNTDIMIYLE